MKSKPAKTKPITPVVGTWHCSCGDEITLEIRAGHLTAHFAQQLLEPHTRPGHQLTRIR